MSFLRKIPHHLPKLFIAIPFLLLLYLIFLNPNKSLMDLIFKPKAPEQVPVTVENLDLEGEYVCKTDSMEAYLKNKKLFIRNKETGKLYLYRDDCLYTWQDKTFNGLKTCGLSPYISLFENLNNLKLFNLDTIISSIFPDKDSSGSSAKIKKVLESCVQTPVVNEAVFAMPKDVLFKNNEKPWLRPTFPSSALE